MYCSAQGSDYFNTEQLNLKWHMRSLLPCANLFHMCRAGTFHSISPQQILFLNHLDNSDLLSCTIYHLKNRRLLQFTMMLMRAVLNMLCRQHVLEMFTINANVILVFQVHKIVASFLHLSRTCIEMQSPLAFYVAFETHLDIVYLLRCLICCYSDHLGAFQGRYASSVTPSTSLSE